MIMEFELEELSLRLKASGYNRGKRGSIIGVLKRSGFGLDAAMAWPVIVHLERGGFVRVVNYLCPCGACTEEELVSLVRCGKA